jgi:hypothetical protein
VKGTIEMGQSIEALLEQAGALVESGDYSQANKLCMEVLSRHDPKNAPAWWLKVRIFLHNFDLNAHRAAMGARGGTAIQLHRYPDLVFSSSIDEENQISNAIENAYRYAGPELRETCREAVSAFYLKLREELDHSLAASSPQAKVNTQQGVKHWQDDIFRL